MRWYEIIRCARATCTARCPRLQCRSLALQQLRLLPAVALRSGRVSDASMATALLPVLYQAGTVVGDGLWRVQN